VAIVGIVIKGGHGIVSPIPRITFCYAASTQADTLWALYLPDIVFETIAFSFALWQTYRHIKAIKLPSRDPNTEEMGSEKPLGQQLIEIMFQDSLLYIVCILVLFMANCLLFKFEPDGSGLGQILQGPTQSLLSILGAHMLLHTREVVEKIYHPEFKMSTLKPIQFVEGQETSPAEEIESPRSCQPAEAVSPLVSYDGRTVANSVTAEAPVA